LIYFLIIRGSPDRLGIRSFSYTTENGDYPILN
jgi:hypothetical protein